MESDAIMALGKVTRERCFVLLGSLVCIYNVCCLSSERQPGTKGLTLGHVLFCIPASAETCHCIPEHHGATKGKWKVSSAHVQIHMCFLAEVTPYILYT
jgi:hypothetical protein